MSIHTDSPSAALGHLHDAPPPCSDSQVSPKEQTPHSRTPPQPSSSWPHVVPVSSQLSGTQQVPSGLQLTPSLQGPHSRPHTGSGPHSISEQSAVSGQVSSSGSGGRSPSPKPLRSEQAPKIRRKTAARQARLRPPVGTVLSSSFPNSVHQSLVFRRLSPKNKS